MGRGRLCSSPGTTHNGSSTLSRPDVATGKTSLGGFTEHGGKGDGDKGGSAPKCLKGQGKKGKQGRAGEVLGGEDASHTVNHDQRDMGHGSTNSSLPERLRLRCRPCAEQRHALKPHSPSNPRTERPS